MAKRIDGNCYNTKVVTRHSLAACCSPVVSRRGPWVRSEESLIADQMCAGAAAAVLLVERRCRVALESVLIYGSVGKFNYVSYS